MIDSPAGDDLAELTSLSRSGRPAAPSREPAASLLSLSHVTLSKNPSLTANGAFPESERKGTNFTRTGKIHNGLFSIKTMFLTSFH